MGSFRLISFDPDAAAENGWAATDDGSHDIELPFALATAGLGMPTTEPLLFPLIQTQIDLVARLLDCPPAGQPLRTRPIFSSASAPLKRLASESLGLASAAALAELRHGWSPHLGWPTDLDLIPLDDGVRPDLLFPTFAGDVAAEARGRSLEKQATVRAKMAATTDQATRMQDFEQWILNHATKVYMAWTWFNADGARVDYFDPGQVSRLIEPPALADALQHQAVTAFESAEAAGVPDARPLDRRVRGAWSAPVGSSVEVFVGVLHPDEVLSVPTEPLLGGPRSDYVMGDPVSARVGPIVVATRPPGTGVDEAELLQGHL
jgi:hypothetical protein